MWPWTNGDRSLGQEEVGLHSALLAARDSLPLFSLAGDGIASEHCDAFPSEKLTAEKECWRI